MMDVNAVLVGVWNVVMFVASWLQEHLQTQEQWVIFVAGVSLILVGAYSAWRARKIASYKLSVFSVKLGFALIFLALGWSNAKEIYSSATQYFGSPAAGFFFVFLSGVLGYEIVSRILPRKKAS